MSTQQPTLTDSEDADVVQDVSERERVLAERGAVYGRTSADDEFQTDGPTRACTCGNDVPGRVARVMGDNDGNVPGCPECVDGVDTWPLAIGHARDATVGGGRQ